MCGLERHITETLWRNATQYNGCALVIQAFDERDVGEVRRDVKLDPDMLKSGAAVTH